MGTEADHPEYDMKLALMDEDDRTGVVTTQPSQFEFDFGRPVTLTGFLIHQAKWWFHIGTPLYNFRVILNSALVMASNTTDDTLGSENFTSVIEISSSTFYAGSDASKFYVDMGTAVTARYWRIGRLTNYVGLNGISFFCGRQGHVFQQSSAVTCTLPLCRTEFDL